MAAVSDRLRLRHLLFGVLALFLVVVAAWAHLAPTFAAGDGRRVACGSPAAPIDAEFVVGSSCSSARINRQALHSIAMVALVALVVAPALLGWARRRSLLRSFKLTDGATTIRWPSRREANRLRDTIDQEVLDAFGWSDDDRTEFLGTLVPGPGAGVLVIVEPGGRPIGGAVLMPVGLKPLVTRLAVWIAPPRRRMGHGARAIELVMQRFVWPGAIVFAEVAPDNDAGRRLLEASGFERAPDHGDRVDYVRPAIVDAAAPPTPAVPLASSPATPFRLIGFLVLIAFAAVFVVMAFGAVSDHVSPSRSSGRMETSTAARWHRRPCTRARPTRSTATWRWTGRNRSGSRASLAPSWPRSGSWSASPSCSPSV